LQLKNEDFAWLTEKKEDDFAKDIISRLLHKINELERTVTGHAGSGTFTKLPPTNVRESDSFSDVHR